MNSFRDLLTLYNKNILIISLCILCISFGAAQNNYRIDFSIEEYENEEIIVAREFLNRYPVLDTLKSIGPGKFKFEGDSTLSAGVYLFVLPPDNSFLTFLIDEDDQNFSIQSNYSDLAASTRISNSSNNDLYYKHLVFTNETVQKLNFLNDSLANNEYEITQLKYSSDYDHVLSQLRSFREQIIQENPKLLVSSLIGIEIESEIPSFLQLSENQQRIEKYKFRKNHYFDFIDFKDDRLLYSEAFFDKIFYYLYELTPNDFDSLIVATDLLLGNMNVNGQMFKYYLDHLMIEFASSDIIGMDKVFVHLVENYYGKGLAYWVEKEALEEMVEDALRRKPLLMGNPAPDILMERRQGHEISLYDVNSKYTLLYLWQPGCSHCKKSMPYVKEAYSKYKNKGLEVFSACTKVGSKVESCWSYIDENQLDSWINAVDSDLSSRFIQKYMAEKTPKLYILDQDKKIVLKDFDAEQLDLILAELLD